MWSPKLSEKVVITLTGIKGKVVGIWYSEHDEQYLIQYATNTGQIVETWLHTGDISPADEKKGQ